MAVATDRPNPHPLELVLFIVGSAVTIVGIAVISMKVGPFDSGAAIAMVLAGGAVTVGLPLRLAKRCRITYRRAVARFVLHSIEVVLDTV